MGFLGKGAQKRSCTMCVDLESILVLDRMLARERRAKSELSQEVQRALWGKADDAGNFAYKEL